MLAIFATVRSSPGGADKRRSAAVTSRPTEARSWFEPPQPHELIEGRGCRGPGVDIDAVAALQSSAGRCRDATLGKRRFISWTQASLQRMEWPLALAEHRATPQ